MVDLTDHEDWDGLYNGDTQEIYIRSGMSMERTKEVIIHEILHAIVFTRRLKLGFKEERVVDQLAAATVLLIQQNPKFCKWLFD